MTLIIVCFSNKINQLLCALQERERQTERKSETTLESGSRGSKAGKII